MRTICSIIMAAAMTLFISCGDNNGPKPPGTDLRGSWTLTLPAGFKKKTKIEYAGKMRYRIITGGNTGGIYEMSGSKLKKMNPKNDRDKHYIWEIEDKDNLLLVEAPSVGAVGSDYTGAIISR
jgi:hypothetical protein